MTGGWQVNYRKYMVPVKTEPETSLMETIYNPPSKFFIKPFATVVRVMGDTIGEEIEYSLYIQTSRHATIMRWVEWGEFLAEALGPKSTDARFIKEIMESYITKKGEVTGE